MPVNTVRDVAALGPGEARGLGQRGKTTALIAQEEAMD